MRTLATMLPEHGCMCSQREIKYELGFNEVELPSLCFS